MTVSTRCSRDFLQDRPSDRSVNFDGVCAFSMGRHRSANSYNIDRPSGRLTANTDLGKLESDWGADGQAATVAIKAARDLSRIERRRSWKNLDKIIDEPCVPALLLFALRRSERVPSPARSRRLTIAAHKLQRIYAAERRVRQFKSFMAESSRPVDRAWIETFLGNRGPIRDLP